MDALPEHDFRDGDKLTAVSLRGAATTESGKLVRSRYFNILNNSQDDYTDITFTPDEAKRVHNVLAQMTSGLSSSVPVICTAHLCPWRDRCIYFELGKAPLGKQCLIELNILKQAQMDYLEEYAISLDNRTEMSMVQELSEIEVFLHRANLNMALDPLESTGIVDSPIGFSHDGTPINQKAVSMNIELRERLLTRKHKLVKLMVGDRQEKYRKEAALKIREETDPSSRMAEIRSQLDTMSKKLGAITTASALRALSAGAEPVGKNTLTPDDVLEK